MSRITGLEATRRAHKAWNTRWRKYGHAAALGGAVYLSQRSGRDIYRNTKHKAVWHRPNGDRVKITGFRRAEMDRLRPMFGEFDRRVAVQHSIDSTKVRKHSLPLAVQLTMHGAAYTAPTRKDAINEFNKVYKERYDITPGKKTQKAAGVLSTVIAGAKKHPTISVSPKGVKRYGPHVDYVVAHELAHQIDAGYKVSGSNTWKEAAQWRRDAEPYGTGTHINRAKRKGYTGKGYQSVSPSEDFAETFALSLTGPIPGRRTVLDKSRYDYLNKHIFKP